MRTEQNPTTESRIRPLDKKPEWHSTERLPVTDAVIKREVRWLREAGHDFAADLIEGMWSELQGQKT